MLYLVSRLGMEKWVGPGPSPLPATKFFALCLWKSSSEANTHPLTKLLTWLALTKGIWTDRMRAETVHIGLRLLPWASARGRKGRPLTVAASVPQTHVRGPPNCGRKPPRAPADLQITDKRNGYSCRFQPLTRGMFCYKANLIDSLSKSYLGAIHICE